LRKFWKFGKVVLSSSTFRTSRTSRTHKTMPKGISINIGINELDSAHYGNSFQKLNSCERDARNMASLAQSQGFKVGDIKLKIGKPRAQEIIDEIKKASAVLTNSGDLLLVTYSGHGNRAEDVNSEKMAEFEELSGFDQTWCLFDRQLIDDELAQLWSLFKPGVRILFISDSCYSGEVFRSLNFFGEIDIISGNPERSINPFAESTTIPVENGLIRFRSSTLEAGSKQLSPTNNILDKNWTIYKKVKKDLENALAVEKTKPGNGNIKSFRDLIKADVISLSACDSHQTARDGTSASVNSVFTAALKKIWYGTTNPAPLQPGSFTGSYEDFFAKVKHETMSRNPGQSPIFDGFNHDGFKKQKPCFRI
jgi:metacaspase-1